MENKWKQWEILFSWASKSLQMVTAAIKLKDASSLEFVMDWKAWHASVNGLQDWATELNDFSSSHIQMWELDHKEGWALKNWCFQTAMLEKTLESPLDSKEIKPVNPKGNQPWIVIGRTDAEAETPILWPPDGKNGLIGKDPDAGKDWRQEEKVAIEDEMVVWHHWLNGCEFEWTPGVGDGQGGLACCDSWGCKELDTTEQLNWSELNMPV